MRQLLNFGRKAPLTYRKVNIDEVIRECLELLEYRLKNIALTLDFNLSEQFCIDIEALRQIIVNTALNAIQAMPDGGSLTLRTKHIYNRIIIVVQDSGIGITPELTKRIFDPFFTTKEVDEGTGLGLAVTYSLIQQMGGNIDVESEPGKGTVFTISIPAEKRQVKQADSQASMADKEC